jgi:hypothetical protein
MKYLFILLFFILSAIMIAYIDYGIRTYDMRFYSGKDNGYFLRFESVICLSTGYYLLNVILQSERKIKTYLKYGITGFVLGIISSVICYLIIPSDDYGLKFHILSVILCYISLHVIKVLKAKKHPLNNECLSNS